MNNKNFPIIAGVVALVLVLVVIVTVLVLPRGGPAGVSPQVVAPAPVQAVPLTPSNTQTQTTVTIPEENAARTTVNVGR